MDNPGIFLIVILGVFFVLWLVGGGPNKAISFSGPFITPITNEGQTQTGYGPQLHPNATLTVPGASVGVGEKTSAPIASTQTDTAPAQTQTVAPTSQSSTPGNSPYAGEVTIQKSVISSNANPGQKYDEFLLTTTASSPITLTNWQILSNADEAHIYIPNGQNTSLTLTPGQPTLIVTPFPSTYTHDTIQLFDGNADVVDTLTY